MIRFFSQHPTAANLLMLAFLIAGALSTPQILRESQPDFTPSQVEIRVLYPGATAQEVEEVVCQRIEDALDGINYVKEIQSDAREGIASIVVEMTDDGQINTLLSDIKTEVTAIDDFPAAVEDPIISDLGRTQPVLSVLVAGPMEIADLKTYSIDLKDRMQEAGIPLIKIEGFADHQVRISLSDSKLRRMGLSVSAVAQRIANRSMDIPLGAIEARERDILLRFDDQRRTPVELENLVIWAAPDGGIVRLGDIAEVEDLFQLDEEKIMKDGRRNALIKIEKASTQDAIQIARKVKAFLEEEQVRHPQIDMTITQDETNLLKDRLNMLITNGVQGLLLVFATMWLFFNLRISFWVTMGLPVSFLGAFILVPHVGLSINMFTMVGLLMALGLLMDDAIVIADNIMSHRQQGKSPLTAAVDGTMEVAAGVISSFLTTVCILGPLAFIQGQIGEVLKVVPMMLLLVLAVSLVEAFWILPAHINHTMHGIGRNKVNRFRRRFDTGFKWVQDCLVGGAVKVLIRQRYIFFTSLIGVFILSLGMLASGKIKFQSFPDLEGDVVSARLLMPQGTPLSRTESIVQRLLEALESTNQRFKPDQPDNQDLVQNAYVQYNRNTEAFENGPHVATITVDLLTAEKRSGTIETFLASWRQNMGQLPDVLSLTLSEPGFGPGGRPIEVRLRGKDLNEMKHAMAELQGWFSQFEGVINMADDLRPGKPELRLRMRDEAYGIGIEPAEIGRQIRAAFQGLEADKVQTGPQSYEIEVRLAGKDRDELQDLENFNLVLIDGTQVPLRTVVKWELEKGWARIARFNGMRTVTLRGDVDTRFINASELMRLFRSTFLKDFNKTYPNIKITITGSLEETATTRKSMLKALMIGLIGIFILLSFQFRSYTEPFIVMLAIPFSLIGVIWGHGIMGVPISMSSLLGFIALGGVVVNNSILLVIFLKNARKEGVAIQDAAINASKDRFRAILITSTTTIAGLLPLLFERSLQAQILIPLVISTAFGLMASTLLVLFAIPCMYVILGDFGIVDKIDDISKLPSTKKNNIMIDNT